MSGDPIDEKIRAIKGHQNIYQLGRVIKVKNYVLMASGLEDVGFYERVVIGDKAEGYISKIQKNHVVIELARQSAPIFVGDEVKSTGEPFTAKFSPDALGHVVDIFGNDKLREQSFKNTIKLHFLTEPAPIMARTSVNRPMYTGIAGIDLLYPVGCGQRQLIIGDKKTGKTQIVLDAIANQQGRGVICVYVALGKTKKSVLETYEELRDKGALSYTIILAAFQDDSAPSLVMAPQVGAAIATHYMLQGKDVLLIIDDLTQHANVYREVSMLSGKMPGRDGYPPDIFYTHANLLEKGCQHECGGSITILPLIETRGGDITDYIATNVISITDGQIVLSKKEFDKGQKPAIHYGLSVSRLGGAVQIPPMRKLGAKVRRELLSYLETREVFELGNMDEMSEDIRTKIIRGRKILSNMKQYKFELRSPEEMLACFREVVDEE